MGSKVSLAARVMALEAALSSNPVTAALMQAAEAKLGSMPAGQILAHIADGAAHPADVSAHRATLLPQAVPGADVPADLDLATLAAAVVRIEAKLNALVAATGMAGSAAMAAHP